MPLSLEELEAKLNAHMTASATELAAVRAENEALKRHAARVLAEKKKLQGKTRARDDDDTDDEADGDDDTSAEDTRSNRRRGADPDLARVAKDYDAKLEAMQKKLDEAQEKRNKSAIDAALRTALDKANVAPQYRAAAEALIKTGRKVEVVDDAVLVDGKPAIDTVVAWAATDEGRAFVAGPASGGSAASSTGPSGAISKTRSQMTRSEKGAYINDHGLDAFNKLPR